MSRPRALAWALGGCLAAVSVPAAAITADEVIQKCVEARGGAAKLAALTSLSRSGKLIVPGFNVELKVRELKARGGEYRQDVTLQGLTQVQATDGKQAWQIQPLALSSDIDFPFVNYRQKGHTVELLGQQDIDGTPAWALRVHLKWGDDATFYIDPDTWMVIRELDRQTIRGAEQLSETDYGEYERVAGVYVPMTEEQGPKDADSSQKQKIVYDKAEGNVALPASEFALPATPAKTGSEAK